MSEAIQLDECLDETSSIRYPSRPVGPEDLAHGSSGPWASRKSGKDGGDMDDVLKRLGAVESSVSEIKAQVSGIAATLPTLATKDSLSAISAAIPHLATKSGLDEVKGQVGAISAIIPYLATKADLSTMETKIIKWIIATVLTTAGLSFSIAKFVH
jgi:hypothetical protein